MLDWWEPESASLTRSLIRKVYLIDVGTKMAEWYREGTKKAVRLFMQSVGLAAALQQPRPREKEQENGAGEDLRSVTMITWFGGSTVNNEGLEMSFLSHVFMHLYTVEDSVSGSRLFSLSVIWRQPPTSPLCLHLLFVVFLFLPLISDACPPESKSVCVSVCIALDEKILHYLSLLVKLILALHTVEVLCLLPVARSDRV